MNPEDNQHMHRLIAEKANVQAEADAIFNKQVEEGRDLTDEERSKLEALAERRKSSVAAIERYREELKLKKQFEDPGDSNDPLGVRYSGGGEQPPAVRSSNGVKTMGEMFVESGVWQAIKAAHQRGHGLPKRFQSDWVAIEAKSLTEALYRTKAAQSPLLESNATNSSIFTDIMTVLPGVETPGLRQLPPTAADLLRVVTITVGNRAVYRILKNRSFPDYPGSEPVSEGAAKPTASYEFDVVEVPLTKLAAVTKISEEFVEDDQAVIDFINNDLPAQIRQEEDEYVVTELYDTITDASALGTATTKADQIASAIKVIQDNGYQPNAMLLTPADYWLLATEKYGTGAGDKEYVAGGPYGGATVRDLWGMVRPVITPNAITNHPLVGDFNRGAFIQRKGGMRMDSTNSDQDDFVKDLITLRVEQREAVKKVDNLAFKKANIS